MTALNRTQLWQMDTPQLRDEYRKIRFTTLQFTQDTTQNFDGEVRAIMSDEGWDPEPRNFVRAAQLVLDETLAEEDERLSENEYDGDGPEPEPYFEDFYDDHMGYDTLAERDMDREEC